MECYISKLRVQFHNIKSKLMLSFENEEIAIRFEKERIKNIRKNWKSIFIVLYIGFGFLSISSFFFFTDENTSIREGPYIAFAAILILNYGVNISNQAARYGGGILMVSMTTLVGEINARLPHYRLYEGFLTVVSMNFLFSIHVVYNWYQSSIAKVLALLYFIMRMRQSFGSGLPPQLYVGIMLGTTFHGIAGYVFHRTIRQEFIANYRNKMNMNGYKSFLQTLPQGVMIVEDSTNKIRFINKQFKNSVKIAKYIDNPDQLELYNELQTKANSEFEEIIKNSSNSMNEFEALRGSQKRIDELLALFKISYPNNIKEEAKERDFDIFDELPYSFGNDLNLIKFLSQERKLINSDNLDERHTEVELSWSGPQQEHTKANKKQYIIKTCKVNMSDNSNSCTPVYLHTYIETTQIQQLEEAKAQNNYQRQMLANVSHEFRTPLNAIIMSLDLMKDSITGNNMKFLKIALSSSKILASLIEDILDHAKIQSGVFEIQEDEFKISDMLAEVKTIFELQTQSKKIELIFNVDNFLRQIKIKSDKQRLKQVLLNLISNALKFTDNGGIYIDFCSPSNNANLDLVSKLSNKKEILISERSENASNIDEFFTENHHIHSLNPK